MKDLVENRFGLPALVVLALAALFGVATVSRPSTATAERSDEGIRVPVESTTVVCPNPASFGAVRTRVAAWTPPAKRGGTGRAEIRSVDSAAGSPPLATLDQPGTPLVREYATGSSPLVINAWRALAAGLDAQQLSRATTGVWRGLAGTRCTEPAASAWYVGPGPAAASELHVYLANVEEAVASVNVMVYSGEGPVYSDTGRGVILEPRERAVISLRDVAPAAQIMAVRVETGRGRVASAVRVRARPGGADWLPVASEPATHVVVPGLAGGGGTKQQLLVAVPGEKEAQVEVEVVTDGGPYNPEGHEVMDVPSASVAVLDLTRGLGGRPTAVRLKSDVPITAGVISTARGGSDVAFSAATGPVTNDSVLAEPIGGRGFQTRLVLSAPERAAKVRISVTAPQGGLATARDVTIATGKTVVVPVQPPAGADRGYGILLQRLPNSGPFYGGRWLEYKAGRISLVTMQPLTPARTAVTVPSAADSLAAVVP